MRKSDLLRPTTQPRAAARSAHRPVLLPLLGLMVLLGGNARADESHTKGYVKENPDEYAKIPQLRTYRAFLPASADLSSRFPTPGQQGKQSSCVAWASSYAARSYYEARRQHWNPNDPQYQFSPSFIYNQIKAGGCDSGSSISDALKLMKRTGVAPLAVFPYDDHNCTRKPDQQALSEAAQFRIDDWSRINLEKMDDIKGQLYAGNPVVFAMFVSDAFDKLSGERIYDDLSADIGEGHAMVLVGYDDARQAFKVMNSWGTRWADQGFGWISYAALKKRIDSAFVMQLAAAPEPAPPEPVPIPAPVAPSIEPTPPEPEVVEPTPPEPEVEPAPPKPALPVSEWRQKLNALTGAAQCARLQGSVDGDGNVTVKGFAGKAEDLTRIAGEMKALGAKVAMRAETRPWPQCEALLSFHDALAKPSGLKLSIAGNARGTLNDGDKLIIQVTTPDYPSYLYLTYLQANGEAVVLAQPDSRAPQPLTPHTQMTLGDGANGQASFSISPPFGNEMIVAIATASPLFSEALPNSQTEREYLTQFRKAFLVKPDAGAASRVFSAAAVPLVTQAKH